MKKPGQWLMLSAVMALGPLVATLRAQDDAPFEKAGPLGLPVSARTVEWCCRTLAFDADQLGAARSLYQGYRTAFAEATARAHKAEAALAEQARKSGDWAAHADVRAKVAGDFVDETGKLERGFLDDLRALCNAGQAPKFVSVERARRRESGLLFALGPGERVDLIAMLDAVRVDRAASPALAEVVLQWESDVDRLLIEKDTLMRSGMRDMMGKEGQPGTADVRAKFFKDLCDIGARIGESSRRAAREAQGLLPEDKLEAFEQEIKVRCYPRIYAGSPVIAAVKAAEALGDVSAEQKSKLAELRRSYDQEARGVNGRWASAADEKQRQLRDLLPEMMGRPERDLKPGDPFSVASADRHSLDDRYLARVNELLTPEQRERVPASQSRAGNIPEFLPDFESDFKAAWDEWKRGD